MKRYYAGIGSRETPDWICDYFVLLSKFLTNKGYILRSGHAKGADQAFERGCDEIDKSKKEIYLPWNGFEGSASKLIVKDKKAFKLANKFHPYWHNLSQGARKLQARNSHQVLGLDLNTPSNFIACWTKNGKGSGGTGQALRIGKHYNIPIFDAGKYANLNEIKINLKLFLEENTDIFNLKGVIFNGLHRA